MLRPTKGERKQVEREALGEDGGEEVVGVLLGLVVREAAVVDSNTRLWSTTVDTAAVVLDCDKEERVNKVRSVIRPDLSLFDILQALHFNSHDPEAAAMSSIHENPIPGLANGQPESGPNQCQKKK
ncbi:hypothetical protein OIU84_022640 [Salix udensis]|uniref:DNA repair protein RAD5A UBA domain-containing protein n=1 Tax=Salix udensis TaxID=889485 RepID=A0AAD6KPE7_9ROSI|nr:hypothetical protein OIU84_022640 [Salix udensis]